MFPTNSKEAWKILLAAGEDPDTPADCHRHCSHWDEEGECCDCGDVRTPNHNYQPEPIPKPEGWPYYDQEGEKYEEPER